MQRTIQILLAAAVLLFAVSASAIESTSAIKATTLLKTSTSWDGTLIAYPQGQAEITGMMVEIEPGAQTGWHLHPAPSFGVILEGVLEVELKDGTRKLLKAGDAVAEVVGKLHNGRNVGAVPVKLVVFYAGVSGQVTSLKAADH